MLKHIFIGIFAKIRLKEFFFCLILAFTLWLFNALNNDYETLIGFPIRYSYDANQYISLQQPDKIVKVRVSGFGWHLLYRALWSKLKPVKLKVDQIARHKSLSTKMLLGDIRNSIPEIKILSLEQDSIFFNFEKLDQKQVALRPDLSSLILPANREIESTILTEPSFVQVKGPESALKNIPDTIVFALSNTTVEEYYNELVSIHYHPNPFVKIDKQKVRVQFQLKTRP